MHGHLHGLRNFCQLCCKCFYNDSGYHIIYCSAVVCFAAIIASVYGWVGKKVFRLLGAVLFSFGNIFTLCITHRELCCARIPDTCRNHQPEMEEEIMEELLFSAQLFRLISLGLGIACHSCFVLQWKEWKGRNLLIILTGLAGVAGFFIITDALKSL